MVADYEMEGFVLTERMLEAVDLAPTIEKRRPPASYASENRSVCRDQNRRGHGLVLQSDGVVELVYYTGQAEFIQRWMQPQLLWRTNYRTPLHPTYLARTERRKRGRSGNLYGSRSANGRSELARNVVQLSPWASSQ